jgi:hypothetical protein
MRSLVQFLIILSYTHTNPITFWRYRCGCLATLTSRALSRCCRCDWPLLPRLTDRCCRSNQTILVSDQLSVKSVFPARGTLLNSIHICSRTRCEVFFFFYFILFYFFYSIYMIYIRSLDKCTITIIMSCFACVRPTVDSAVFLVWHERIIVFIMLPVQNLKYHFVLIQLMHEIGSRQYIEISYSFATHNHWILEFVGSQLYYIFCLEQYHYDPILTLLWLPA